MNEEQPEWIFFSEEAEVLSVDIFGGTSDLPDDDLNVMKEYVKKSYKDKNSLLYKYFEQVLNEDLFKKKYSDSKLFWRDQAKLSLSNWLNKFQKK